MKKTLTTLALAGLCAGVALTVSSCSSDEMSELSKVSHPASVLNSHFQGVGITKPSEGAAQVNAFVVGASFSKMTNFNVTYSWLNPETNLYEDKSSVTTNDTDITYTYSSYSGRMVITVAADPAVQRPRMELTMILVTKDANTVTIQGGASLDVEGELYPVETTELSVGK